MTFLIRAPYPAIECITELPQPKLGDGIGLLHTVNRVQSMDGDSHTYVKTTDDRLYSYNFTVTRMKSLELLEFYREYAGKMWKITDHNGDVIVGIVLDNPFSFSPSRRAVYGDGTTDNSEDAIDVNMQFEGELIT